uniref:Uncharacterized protein n=1 Tax=Phlebotomus papatasi TaxID=29031 RepID=A0A1B0GPD9_PHLPP
MELLRKNAPPSCDGGTKMLPRIRSEGFNVLHGGAGILGLSQGAPGVLVEGTEWQGSSAHPTHNFCPNPNSLVLRLCLESLNFPLEFLSQGLGIVELAVLRGRYEIFESGIGFLAREIVEGSDSPEGFFFGLIVCISNGYYGLQEGLTREMLSRCELHSLVVGILIALPSGAAVAIGILGENAGSLAGVAISASLLPPAVNSGFHESGQRTYR